MNEKQTEEFHQALFVNLVMMLGSMAMQQLGKLVDPSTQKAHVDLNGAQGMIDMLSMLRSKTDGNLSDQEARMLKDTLSSLQLTYVETASGQTEKESENEEPKSTPPADEEKTEAGGTEAPEEEKDGVEASSDTGEHKTRFHKSYDQQ